MIIRIPIQVGFIVCIEDWKNKSSFKEYEDKKI